MDNPNFGIWFELVTAHRNLTPKFSSPLGLHDMFKSVFYTFLAATQITGLGAVSDTLIRRVQWDNLMVVVKQILLFDPVTRDIYVREWIDKAKKAFKRHWNIIRDIKLTTFNDAKSFFINYHIYNKNVWEHVPPPDEEEPHNKDKNEEEKGEEAPLDLNCNIKELESNQQEADKSGESFLIKKNVVMAGRYRTAGNGVLELSDTWIMRAMAAHGRIGL